MEVVGGAAGVVVRVMVGAALGMVDKPLRQMPYLLHCPANACLSDLSSCKTYLSLESMASPAPVYGTSQTSNTHQMTADRHHFRRGSLLVHDQQLCCEKVA